MMIFSALQPVGGGASVPLPTLLSLMQLFFVIAYFLVFRASESSHYNERRSTRPAPRKTARRELFVLGTKIFYGMAEKKREM